MGLCASGEELTDAEKEERRNEEAKNKALSAEVHQQWQTDQQINKLLLLGAGESGKSTLFKQMVTLYGKGYPEYERKTFTPIIFNNIITSMKCLVTQAPTFSPLPDELKDEVMAIEALQGDEPIDPALGASISKLWKSDYMKVAYENRAKFQLFDSAQYFFDRLEIIQQPDYIPEEQDVLRSRVRTTGIVENEFEIDSNQFKMFDVGGQRNERKKWIHCFENVTAVIFVAAISEYDQVLYEDENTNRMVEALNLFEEICNSRWFRETSMILFLNKRDLFEIKIKKVPLQVCFPEYDREDTYDAGVQFLKDNFEQKNRNTDKQVYTHITCATDTGNIAAVFDAVKDIIIRRSLSEAGLV